MNRDLHTVYHVDFAGGRVVSKTDYDDAGQIVGGYANPDAIGATQEQQLPRWHQILRSRKLQALGGALAAGAFIAWAANGAHEAATHPQEPTPVTTLGPCRQDQPEMAAPASFPAGAHTEICKLPDGALTRQLVEVSLPQPTRS